MSRRPKPYEPTIRLTSAISGSGARAVPSTDTGTPDSNPMTISGRLGGRRPGHGVDVLGRLVPRVFDDPALDGPAPEVLVDRVQLLLGHRRGGCPTWRRSRRSPPGKDPTGGPGRSPRDRGPAPGCPPRSGPGRCPCRCTRGPPPTAPCRRASATRCLTITGRDSADTSGYLPSYLALAGQGRDAEVLGHLGPGVDHRGLDRPGGQGPVADGLPVLAAGLGGLAHVDGHRDHLDVHVLHAAIGPPPRCPARRCRPAPLVAS